MVTHHFPVPDYLALAVLIYGKLLGCVDTIICGVDLNWHFLNHDLPLKCSAG